MTLVMHYDGLHSVISGGQTGADQGGLMGAWDMNVHTGGTAPSNFYTDTGYNPLLETLGLDDSGTYAERTKVNIQVSSGTVIIARNFASPGTVLTANECNRKGRPLLKIDIDPLMEPFERQEKDVVAEGIVECAKMLSKFIVDNQIAVLNVAGNRDPKVGPQPIFTMTRLIVRAALLDLKKQNLLKTRAMVDDF